MARFIGGMVVRGGHRARGESPPPVEAPPAAQEPTDENVARSANGQEYEGHKIGKVPRIATLDPYSLSPETAQAAHEMDALDEQQAA